MRQILQFGDMRVFALKREINYNVSVWVLNVEVF